MAVPSNLANTVLAYVGRQLIARPYYGWGWLQLEGDDGKPTPVAVPSKFSFTVLGYFNWNGERRGGVGQVSDTESQFHDLWLMFYTCHAGTFDFHDKDAVE